MVKIIKSLETGNVPDTGCTVTPGQPPCLAQTLEQEEKDNEAVSKMMAQDQKNQLLNLFQEKNRPLLTKWPQVWRASLLPFPANSSGYM